MMCGKVITCPRGLITQSENRVALFCIIHQFETLPTLKKCLPGPLLWALRPTAREK